MGIFKFRSWLDKKYRNRADIFVKSVPSNVGCVFLDMNGIFHTIAQKVYGYGKGDPNSSDFQVTPRDTPARAKQKRYKKSKQVERLKRYSKLTSEELKLKLMYKICKKVLKIATHLKVSDYVVMAVDGVAPMAKITQQRKRRFKREDNTTSVVSAAEEDNQVDQILRPTTKFNGNCITPGTEFMFELDYYIQRYIQHNIKENVFQFSNLVYSSHLVPGEGEHKIFDLVRNNQIDIDPSKNHVIYGMDADLVMLSMINNVPNLFLCRDSYEQSIDISALRNEVYNDMTRFSSVKLNKSIVIQDFVLLAYLLGNDFLPRIISFTFKDTQENVDGILQIYSRMNLALTDETGQIIWQNFGKMMTKLAAVEKKVYLPNIAKMQETGYIAYPIESLKVATTQKLDKESGKFEVSVDVNKFSQGWYNKCLTPRNGEVLEELGLNFKVTPSRIMDMCSEYFKGLQWCLRYYLRGHRTVSSRFVYIYHYAPLLTSLAEALEKMTQVELPTISDVKNNIEDPVITPIHQLMCVMPRKD